MMRRPSGAASFNLDSLLDTMTNGVGILIIVLCVTQVEIGRAFKQVPPKPKEWVLKVPRRYVIKDKVTRIHFFCRRGRIYHVDMKEVADKLDAGVTAIVGKRRQLTSAETERIEDHFERNNIGTSTVRLKLVSLSFTMKLVLELRPEARGETEAELRAPGSAFRKLITTPPPAGTKWLVSFSVWADSFGPYIAAREIVDRLGLHGFWAPYDMNEELSVLLIGSGDGPDIGG